MESFERELRNAREHHLAESSIRETWDNSPFTEKSPVVNHPRGAFAAFVSEVIPHLPRKVWAKGIVGRSPDGLMRVAVDWTQKFGEGTVPRAATRAARSCTKCKIFCAWGADLVVLQDGRAGYIGDLNDVRAVVARQIASNHFLSEYKWGVFDPYAGRSAAAWKFS